MDLTLLGTLEKGKSHGRTHKKKEKKKNQPYTYTNVKSFIPDLFASKKSSTPNHIQPENSFTQNQNQKLPISPRPSRAHLAHQQQASIITPTIATLIPLYVKLPPQNIVTALSVTTRPLSNQRTSKLPYILPSPGSGRVCGVGHDG